MNWKTEILENVTVISKGKKHLETDGNGAKRYIQIEDLGRKFTPKYTFEKGVDVEENDVIIAWDGANAGKVGVGLSGVIGSTLARIRLITDKIIGRYLFWFLQSKEAEIRSKRTGATIPHVNGSELRNMILSFPDVNIQQRIVSILDEADALRKADVELLDKYDELLDSVFSYLFGSPIKNEKKFPARRLKEVCSQITDGTHFSPPNVEKGIHYVTAKHIKSGGIDFYRNPTYIALEDHKKIYARCAPEKGDVLYVKDGATTGAAAINKFDFEFSMLSSLALLKPNKQIVNSYYLNSWLNNKIVKKKLIGNMSGAAIKRFTLAKIKEFEIIVPPISLQNDFEKMASNIEEQKALLFKQQQQSEVLFQSLLQKAFKGEL